MTTENDNLKQWPREKVLLVKLAELQIQCRRVLLAGTETIKNARKATKATVNVRRADLAALGVELQRLAVIKWPVRKQPWWKRLFKKKDAK